MQPIEMPQVTLNVQDSVLAQAIAGHSGWQQNDAGAVFDEDGVIVADSLSDLGHIARSLGWLTPSGSRASGVVWSKMPHSSEDRADNARSGARKLGL
ncbi:MULTISPECIES: hypothetical protein [unclassified Microbacterium]|uniref:hypothetical protein n=1 Tax=unclassified Microbacterium TaxID=2609290 RepID=UPI000CFA9FA6|nr:MULTISPECIES: hypothetical protein [unclassified Microbacterium]PQZ53157.1 hypothetical protein CQ032_15745 [Microbacterium sp. MYb43]PQZ74699.1 hypothetical protein CQ031_15090 [Microbacterium sp. MYb40]PRB18787.1 hypothetical protein CQ040_16395 [Microbacterium sp. MYb54]PRB23647.1 hypothetical protein CQ037_17195 [Microbacterium sp. MYb50]PRB63344.1 hypothetical protein CQ021_16710 [Microbacterium sp. MYb24]